MASLRLIRSLMNRDLSHLLSLWFVPSGEAHGAALEGHTGYVSSVALSPDGGLLASASGDHTVRLWSVPSGEAHGAALEGGLLASASGDKTVRLWSPAH